MSDNEDVKRQFLDYQTALLVHKVLTQFDVFVNNEIHRYHYLGGKRAFAAVYSDDRSFKRFVNQFSFH